MYMCIFYPILHNFDQVNVTHWAFKVAEINALYELQLSINVHNKRLQRTDSYRDEFSDSGSQ